MVAVIDQIASSNHLLIAGYQMLRNPGSSVYALYLQANEKSMRHTCAFYLCLLCNLAAGQSGNQLLLSKEKEMFTAICTGNKALAEQLFANDYITINADGKLQSRAEAMRDFGKFKGSTFRLSGQQIRNYGNVAVITGKAQFYFSQFPVAAVFYTEIWVYDNNSWLFSGWQGTMTGGPSWYPMIFTSVVTLLLLITTMAIRKKWRKLK